MQFIKSLAPHRARKLLLTFLKAYGDYPLEKDFADQKVFPDILIATWCRRNEVEVELETYAGFHDASTPTRFYNFKPKERRPLKVVPDEEL